MMHKLEENYYDHFQLRFLRFGRNQAQFSEFGKASSWERRVAGLLFVEEGIANSVSAIDVYCEDLQYGKIYKNGEVAISLLKIIQ